MIVPDGPSITGATPGEGSSDPIKPEEPLPARMIGDFDDGANPLWTLYGKEAKSLDEARIQTLKEHMDSILLFVRLKFAHLYNRLDQAHVGTIGWFIFRYAYRVHNRL
jgi:hypothetical protein